MEYAGPDRQGPFVDGIVHTSWQTVESILQKGLDFLEAPSKLISNGRMTLQS
jgi:hypothetical protein